MSAVALFFRAWENAPTAVRVSRMSPLTRFGFAALIGLYGIYQISNDHAVAGLIGIGLAALLVWLGGKM